MPTALDGAVQYQPVYDIFIAFDLCITSLTTHTLSAELENKKKSASPCIQKIGQSMLSLCMDGAVMAQCQHYASGYE